MTRSCSPGVGDFVDGLHLRDVLAAVFPDQLESVFLDRLEMRTLVYDGDFIAGKRELGAHQSADCAGTDDTNLHGFLLSNSSLWATPATWPVLSFADARALIHESI